MLNTQSIEDVSNNKNRTVNTFPSVKDGVDALNLPKTKFQTWSGFQSFTPPATSALYQLKENYSLSEVKALALKLATFDDVRDYSGYVMSNTIGKAGQIASILIFNKKTGEFSYSATGGIPLSGDKNTIDEKIYDFIKKINWYDPTMKIIASYKLRNDPDNTYYEIKRDWSHTGLPILNPIGLLNLDENTAIDSLELNDKSSVVIQNADIYNTSDNKDGLQRNSDFNTMTIGISDATKSVVVLNSNIRKMDTAEPIQTPIISYNEAAARLRNNEQSFILTTPTNIGDVTEWQKIYPNQLAEAKQAVITESTIAYLEQSPTAEQKILEPYYIFRGKAKLTSNYEINFIAAVSAIHKTQASKATTFSFSFIPQVYAANGDIGQIGNQKQGAFDLILTPAPPTPTPAPFAKCVPGKDDLNPLNPSAGSSNSYYGWSPIAVINGEVRISKKGWWYYVPDPGTTEATLRNDINQILIQIQTIVGSHNFRNFNTGLPPNILSDFQATRTACPIRVTGDSPTIFIYAPAGSKFSIQPARAVVYTEPLLNNRSWNVLSSGNGSMEVNNTHHDYLYYEYSDITFSRPKTGWIIKKNDINTFAGEVGLKLKLTAGEKTRLIYELNHATKKLSTQSIFIGLISRAELDTKLPLTVSPQPKIYRYFFYIGADTGKYTAPHISPIQRTDSMIIEIGSYAEK